MRWLSILSLMLTVSCAAPEEEIDQEAPKKDSYRSWTEFCQSKHPGCILKGFNFKATTGEEVCVCKPGSVKLKSKDGSPSEFHP